MRYPWLFLFEWQPFRVDALGLITLLGAEEINTWVGRLVPSRWIEYMPFLAMYVIAGDRFRAKTPSFSLYNISAGITTTECSAWFTRWVLCQNFPITRGIVFWEIAERPQRRQLLDSSIAALVSFCFTGLLLAISVLSRDFYGTANACAIIMSILTRAYILCANRMAIDSSVLNSRPVKDTQKTIVITPDAKVITMFIPNAMIIPVFIRNPHPKPGLLYRATRWISWIAFGTHVITIGMAGLASQIYTIALILASSILVSQGFGCADTVRPVPVSFEGGGNSTAYTCWIGSHLKATVFEWPSFLDFEQTPPEFNWRFRDSFPESQPDTCPRSERRMDLYAWLNLTDEEEESFSKWDLLPHKRNGDTSWERDFLAKKTLVRNRGPDIMQIKRRVDQSLERNIFESKQHRDDIESRASEDDREINTLARGHSQNAMSVRSTTNGRLEENVDSQPTSPIKTATSQNTSP